MSIKSDALWGGLGQAYVAVVSIITLPLYLKYLGVEAYGLISFFFMFQMWFMLLDVGIGQTLSRQAALFRGGLIDADSFAGILVFLKRVSFLLSIAGGALVLIFSEEIVVYWLHLETLSIEEARTSVCLMAVSMMLRLYSSVFRGVATGLERIAWLSGFNAVVASFRWGGVLPALYLYGASVEVFFGFQVLVSVFENLVLAGFVRQLAPAARRGYSADYSILRFSLSLGMASVLWLMISQLDKLLLSGVLSLAEYGYFNVAVVVSGVISFISGPISTAIMPRLSRLHSEGNTADFFFIYNSATQVVAVLAFSICAVCLFMGRDLVYLWTGSMDVAEKVAPILSPYVIGNALLALVAFPYYMQFAYGNLRLHNSGNVVFLVTLVPIVISASLTYGAVGAAYAWMFINLFFFFFWAPLVHHRFAAGTHIKWVMNNILPVFIMIFVAANVAYHSLLSGGANGFSELLAFGLVVTLSGAAGAGVVRRAGIDLLRKSASFSIADKNKEE